MALIARTVADQAQAEVSADKARHEEETEEYLRRHGTPSLETVEAVVIEDYTYSPAA